MHILDGYLDLWIAAIAAFASITVLALAAPRSARTLAGPRAPLLNVFAAAIFAAQMLNLPIPGGTSVHFVVGAFAAILLGPHLPALAVEPDLVLLDEPVSVVDAKHGETIIDALAARHQAGATLVISTPDADLVPRVSDRVVLLDRARSIVRDGLVREVLTDNPLLEGLGVSPPRITETFVRARFPNPPITVEEAVDRLSQDPDTAEK